MKRPVPSKGSMTFQTREKYWRQGASGNLFCLYEDIPNLWDAWDVDIFYEEVEPSHPSFEGIMDTKNGDLFVSAKLRFSDEKYSIEQTIKLYHHSSKDRF